MAIALRVGDAWVEVICGLVTIGLAPKKKGQTAPPDVAPKGAESGSLQRPGRYLTSKR